MAAKLTTIINKNVRCIITIHVNPHPTAIIE
jgi:hypothetical protein